MPMNCFSKIREAGRAICDTCNQHINYGTSGKNALKKHVEHPKHLKAWKTQQQNMRIDIIPSDNIIVAASPNNPVQPRIPPLCNRVAQDQVSADSFCGFNSNEQLACNCRRVQSIKCIVILKVPSGRTRQGIVYFCYEGLGCTVAPENTLTFSPITLQALVLGFVAENSLPLSITPGLIDCKTPKSSCRTIYGQDLRLIQAQLWC